LGNGQANRVTIGASADTDADGSIADETTATVTLGTNDDTVTGSASKDTVVLGSGSSYVALQGGDDTIQVSDADMDGFNTIDGGSGNDTIAIADDSGADAFIDNDFTGVTSVEALTFANNATTITIGAKGAAAGISSITGGTAADTFTLASLFTNNVTLSGGGGADSFVLTSYSGTASITGGSGVDTITLGSGNATIVGNDGADVVTLGAGDVNITFSDGSDDSAADVLIVTNGQLTAADVVVGGGGSDVIQTSGAVTFADSAFTYVSTVEVIDAATNDGALTATLGTLAQAAGLVTISGGDAVDSINISAYTASATVTGAAGADSIVGGSVADSIDGGTGNDTIRGGDGDDVLVGDAGADRFIFEATGADNGNDTITFVVADDFMNFGAFLPSGSFNSTVIEYNGTTDVDITNKVVLLAGANGSNAAVDQASEIAALIQGNGDAMYLTSGGKGIVIAGDDSAATGAQIYFVNDSLGANVGTIETDDVVLVGTLATFDLDTLTIANFIFTGP